jgi:hypothetical protein
MSVIVSDKNNPNYSGLLSKTNGFYRAEAYALGSSLNYSPYLTSEVDIPVTFANAGNCQGVIIGLWMYGPISDRPVTVRLQENVTGTWTDRSSTTLTSFQILGGTSSGASNLGLNTFYDVWLTPFLISGGYPVDTVAGKWRFAVTQGAGGPNWYIRCYQNTGNCFYIAWCDTQVSFTSGSDCLVVMDPITIDMTCSFKGVPTLDTTQGYCGVVCAAQGASDPATVTKLSWQNPPAAPYTMTLDGYFQFSAHSAFRIGTQASPIPLAQRASLVSVPQTAGTQAGHSGLTSASNSSSGGGNQSGKMHFFFFGQIPAWERTRMALDTAIGATVLPVTDDVGWSPGDQVFVGGQDVRGAGEMTLYTVSGYSAKAITLTAPLAAYNRKAGGSVVRLNGYGISITGNVSVTWPCSFTNVHLSGVSIADTAIGGQSPDGGDVSSAYDAVLGKIYLSHVCAYATPGNANTSITVSTVGGNISVDSCSFCNITGLAFANGPTGTAVGSSIVWPLVSNCWFLVERATGNPVFSNNSSAPVFSGCVFENSGPAFLSYCSEVRGCVFFGCGATTGALIAGLPTNLRSVSKGNRFTNNLLGTMASPVGYTTYQSSNALSINDSFDNNIYDIGISPTSMGINVAYVSPVTSNLKIANPTPAVGTLAPGQFAFSSVNGIPNNDMVYASSGTRLRTGPGLPDTTTRTSGANSFAMRLDPLPFSSSNPWPMEWPTLPDSRAIPTGNSQGKPVTISAWVMMGTAAYYAGIHQNPTLYVRYDLTSSGSAVAVNGTNWQQLAVTVTPQTATPYLEAWLSTSTDYANGRVYVDDLTVTPQYAGDTGKLDVAAYAKPIWPPYSTTAPANFSMNTLASAVSPPAQTETLLYTVPPNALSTVVSSLAVCNQSNLPGSFRISVSPGGGPTTAKDYLYYDVAITGNNTFAATLGLMLSPGSVVRVYSATANLSFSIWGSSVTN